jgi:hypothetical protein
MQEELSVEVTTTNFLSFHSHNILIVLQHYEENHEPIHATTLVFSGWQFLSQRSKTLQIGIGKLRTGGLRPLFLLSTVSQTFVQLYLQTGPGT